MFRATLFTISQSLKQPMCPPPDKYNVIDYSAIEKNGVLIHTTAWVNLKNIMQDEISQTHNDKKYSMFPLI